MYSVTEDTPIKSDRRIGDICIVNGKDVYDTYGADLIGIQELDLGMETNVFGTVGRSTLKVGTQSFKNNKMNVSFYVVGCSLDDAYSRANQLVSECTECAIRIGNSESEYACVLNGYKVTYTDVAYYMLVELELFYVRRLPLVLIDRDLSEIRFSHFQLVNKGTVASGARLAIYAKRDWDEVTITIDGYRVIAKNLKKGIGFVIDGIEGKVYDTLGNNRFVDTDLIDFPKIKSGVNNVTIGSASNVERIQIEYYPTFAF